MDTLKIVVVGCGGMSETWIKTALALPNVEVVGFVDVVEAAAQKRRDQFNLNGTASGIASGATSGATSGAVIGTDLDQVLRRTQPDIVFDITIPEAHYPITKTALAHGCHVLGEKPLANSMDEARELVRLAQEAGKLFVVMQNRRHNPHIRRLRRLVQGDGSRAGQLGPLTTVNIDFYIGAHFGGFRDRMEHVLLLDMAIHTFDQARFITGLNPVAVDYAREWNPAGSWYDHDASAMVVFEFQNGLMVNYRGSWCAEGLLTSWESEWRVVGQHGTAKWDGNDLIEAEIVTQTGGFHSEVGPMSADWDLPDAGDGSKTQGHASLIADFVDCVRTGRQPETTGEDNIKSLAMVFGAIESADKKPSASRRVNIQD